MDSIYILLLLSSLKSRVSYLAYDLSSLYIYTFSDPAASADLAVILMQEGLAHILLIGKRYHL